MQPYVMLTLSKRKGSIMKYVVFWEDGSQFSVPIESKAEAEKIANAAERAWNVKFVIKKVEEK